MHHQKVSRHNIDLLESKFNLPYHKIKSILKIAVDVCGKKNHVKNHDAFLEAIGQKESSNNYKAVNKLGYMGKYQFGASTLKTLNINVRKKIL